MTSENNLETRMLKLAGTALVAPQALPLPYSLRLAHLRFLKKVLYHDLTQPMPAWFTSYMKNVIVAQNDRFDIGKKSLDEFVQIAEFDQVPKESGNQSVDVDTIRKYVQDNFDEPETKEGNVLVQFTGGKDSTLAATIASVYHDGSVTLMNFDNGLIEGLEKVPANFDLLETTFGARYQLVTDNVSEIIKLTLLSRYRTDLKEYGIEMAGFFCGSCRIAMHVKTIEYCLKKGINIVYDGSNRTGFDISQRPWFNEMIRDYYKDFGITYISPVMDLSRSDLVLKEIYGAGVMGSQGDCQGGGETHNTLWRCYSLDRHGKEGHEKILKKWVSERFEIARNYIKAVTE